MKKELKAEKFLREKLESEIQAFGDGNTEFHTRDLEHLLNCMDEKDETIKSLEKKINFNTEKQFAELLEICMTINNLSADQRLHYIRNRYKEIWKAIDRKTIDVGGNV